MRPSLSISARGKELPSSPIRKFVPYAEAAVKRGIYIYSLNLGQPDIESPSEAIEALKQTDLKVISYSHSAGNMSLRQALAKYYQEANLPVEAEDVLITIGGSEAIMNVFCCCFDEGDEIIIPEPYYTNYNFFAQLLGIKIVPIACSIDNNFALPAVADFEKIITPKTKGILINTPGNPTGIVYTKQELLALQDIVTRHNLYLISDEVYSEFCYDGLQHESVLRLQNIEQQVIVIDSFSKKYSLTGIRVGSIVSKNQSLIATFLKFSQGRISPPFLGQIVAEYALKYTNKNYLIAMKNEYEKRRNILVVALQKIPGVKIGMPNGAFYCMAELPIDDAESFAKWLLSGFSYNNSTVMISPANGFYSDPQKGLRQVRIAYVLNEEDLSKAILCLSNGLSAYPHKTV